MTGRAAQSYPWTPRHPAVFPSMEFGVFDHLDKNDRPLARYYSERLDLIAAYERAGFYAYHVAEHHLTDLGMAPSPSALYRRHSPSMDEMMSRICEQLIAIRAALTIPSRLAGLFRGGYRRL